MTRRFNKIALIRVFAAGIGMVALTADIPAASAQQQSGEPIRVTMNKAAILRLAGQAQNVIIGDPRIADVTVENRSMLVLFGRSPGETNLIVLNAQQREILSVPIVVTGENDRHVSVVAMTKSGLTEVVYNCAERCTLVASQGGAAPAASGGGGAQGPVPEGTPAPTPPQAAAPPQTPAATDPAESEKKGYKR